MAVTQLHILLTLLTAALADIDPNIAKLLTKTNPMLTNMNQMSMGTAVRPMVPVSNPSVGMPPQVQIQTLNEVAQESKTPCTCGVFLSGQFKRGSSEQPQGNVALMQELYENFPCNSLGEKQCTNKCLDVLVKHLPNSPGLVCGAMERDTYKERAYLFVKNCEDKWINTNLSAGREYCCKDSLPYKCT